MMRVGDRDGERVGGVGPGNLHARKKAGDHRVDLRLFGAAGSDDRLLDQGRSVFADLDARARALCDDVGLPIRLLHASMRVLSGGEAARASLAAMTEKKP